MLAVSGVGGAAAVVSGAIGAHALALDPASRASHTFDLAVVYLLIHSAVLLALGVRDRRQVSVTVSVAALLFTAGMILFSGSLILATFIDMAALKRFAPYGGAALIAGWLAVGLAAWQGERAAG